MSALAALAFSIQGHDAGAEFFARMTAASHPEIETGHTGHFFNKLWSGPGTTPLGPETTTAPKPSSRSSGNSTPVPAVSRNPGTKCSKPSNPLAAQPTSCLSARSPDLKRSKLRHAFSVRIIFHRIPRALPEATFTPHHAG